MLFKQTALSKNLLLSEPIQQSRQTHSPPANMPERVPGDDPARILHKYILSQTARNQNSRKLKEHLEKIKKYGGKLPKEREHDENWGTQRWLRVVSGPNGM